MAATTYSSFINLSTGLTGSSAMEYDIDNLIRLTTGRFLTTFSVVANRLLRPTRPITTGALVVSVEYRLAPEHPIPTAYDDTWSALRWVASLTDPWLADYADPRRTFLAGDSAGGNIVYHTAVRASRDGSVDDIDIEGVIIVQPYFWGAERLPSEAVSDGTFWAGDIDALWPFVTAGQAGNEDPRLNPPDEEIASLTCRRVLVAVAEKDTLRERGCRLFARIRDYYARTGGEVTLVESEGEDHGFHLYSPLRATSRKLMESIVHFINQPPELMMNGLHLQALEAGKINKTPMSLTPQLVILGVPSRPFRDIFGYGMDMKHECSSGPTCMAYGGISSRIGGGRGKAAAAAAAASNKKASNGLCRGPVRANKAYKGPLAAGLPPANHATKSFFLASA
ncbi:putative carboxylesterase 2 [Dichanthelium oligosanthes]|uniref:Putative carboxylesterase 2 n=1 Tax=Dichanthelium oligosanthes TaxID=888268 RepID=A0A1E5UK09_9POAL|nr:putative carboxylesterase 2 [Dichanthelium oligosanthes]